MTGFVDGAGQVGNRILTTGWDGYPATQCSAEISHVQCTDPRGNPVSARPIFMVMAVDPGFHCDDFVLQIHPPIIPSGNYRNVVNSPPNQAKVVIHE